MPIERQIIGYANRLSAAPGERLDFKVSCHQPGQFEAALVRILGGDDPGGAGFQEKELAASFTGR